jgi:hypothetical protein
MDLHIKRIIIVVVEEESDYLTLVLHLTSSGLSGILCSQEAAEVPFFLDPLEGTETSE